MGYRIKTVADMIGVPRNTLLAWERRYQVVEPARLANGYREYSEEDIARLRELKRLIDAGHRVGEAISLMQASRSASQNVDDQRTADLVEELLGALLRLDRRAADDTLRHAGTMPFARMIDEIFFPLQRHVGELWEEDALDAAQEHVVSHFVRERLQGMLMALDYGPVSGKLTLCASFPEEQHDIALLGLSVKLAMRNHRIIYVGQRTPIDGLISMMEKHRPQLVCVSVTLPRARTEVVAVAQALSAAASGSMVVAIGGTGLPGDGLPPLPRILWATRSSMLLNPDAPR